MILATCISKQYDKNDKIISYRLKDMSGLVSDVQPAALKRAIIEKQIIVDNLKLTKDNKLVADIKKNKQQKLKKARKPTDAALNRNPNTLYTTCLEKLYDANYNISYKLIDYKGFVTYMDSEVLKQAIREKQIIVNNLKLTEDNKFIEKSIGGCTTDADLKRILKSAKNKGLKIKKINSINSINKENVIDSAYVISKKNDTEHLLIIPSNVTELPCLENGKVVEDNVIDCIHNLSGVIKVLGGSGLKSTKYMFAGCSIDALDFSGFNTHNVTNMEMMFAGCTSKHIGLRYLNTMNVKTMKCMFMCCITPSLDFSNFDIRKVRSMEMMFLDCETFNLDLSSFGPTEVLLNINHMFQGCKTKSINLDNFEFDAWKEPSMVNVFRNCKAIISINYHCKELAEASSRESTRQFKETFSNIMERVKSKEEKEKSEEEKQRQLREAERRKMSPGLRYDILCRDNFRCKICGRTTSDGVKLHVDHIKPIAKGGLTVSSNLQTLCDECNIGKSDKYTE